MNNKALRKLENVMFEDCTISELDLYNATLKNVSFMHCAIDRVEFSEAKLNNVDLTRADIVSVKGLRSLKGARITSEQLIQLAPAFAQEIGLTVDE